MKALRQKVTKILLHNSLSPPPHMASPITTITSALTPTRELSVKSHPNQPSFTDTKYQSHRPQPQNLTVTSTLYSIKSKADRSLVGHHPQNSQKLDHLDRLDHLDHLKFFPAIQQPTYRGLLKERLSNPNHWNLLPKVYISFVKCKKGLDIDC